MVGSLCQTFNQTHPYLVWNLKVCNCLVFHSDIDECIQGLAGCDQNCTNTNGSYYCTCMDGYALESDNHTCTGNDCI